MLEYMRVRRIFVYDSNTPSNIPLTKEKKTSNVYETAKWDGYTYIYHRVGGCRRESYITTTTPRPVPNSTTQQAPRGCL